MDFFSLDREIQRDIIKKKLISNDSSLELRDNEAYKVRSDLKLLNQRFYLNGQKTQFWFCQQCQNEKSVIYALEKSRASCLSQLYKQHHEKYDRGPLMSHHVEGN